MKQTRFWLATIATLLYSLTASAHSFEVSGIYYNITSSADLTVEVTYKGENSSTYYNEYSGAVTIPSTVTYNKNTYSVTSIGSCAFDGCSSLTSVTIPEGVTSIGPDAFVRCSSLTSVTIPESVTSIANDAFYCCSSLTYITVAEGNTMYDSRGGCNAIIETTSNTLIAGCSATIIPEGVTSIANDAFYGCSSLTAITIPESVTSIGSSAFENCYSLTYITVAEGNTMYDSRGGCNAIIETASNTLIAGCSATIIPESVTSIGSSAFENCYSLTAITIPESVTSIGSSAFDGCSSLTSVTIPESVTSIGPDAFGYCSSLTSVTIPESVTTIGYSAFFYCSSLTSINIPKSVTSIGSSAFSGCSSLTSITVAEGNTMYDSRGGCNAIIETVSNTLIAGCSATIIPESVTSIGYGAFYGCSSLTAITIPENVTIIGTHAFSYCYSLTYINIPSNVTTIGDYAFYGCYSLTDITIPSSVTSIGYLSFYDCSSLTSIICKAVTPPTLHSEAFLNVKGSIPVYVPEGSVEDYKAAEGWKEFINIVPIEDEKELTLIDGENFAQNKDVEYESITYTRTFNNTNWQALYVPFEIPYGAIGEDFDVAYIYDARQYDRDNDGTKDEIVIEAFKISEGVLEANYPYVIRAKETGEKSITVTDATLYATEENSIDCSSVYDTYTFTGTYSSLSSDELTGCYALSGGMWQPVLEGTSLGAFRFYLKIDSRHGNTIPTQAIKMRIVDEDGNTSTEKLELKTQNSEQIFDLQGRRVESPTKGIYIINGKKVVIK